MRALFSSGWRVAGVAIVVLLVLDAARSIYARAAMRHPYELWRPPRNQYTALEWPPGRNVSRDAPLGRRVYVERCAVCHGLDGRGNGPAAPSLIPRPRDFTTGIYKYRSTGARAMPADSDLRRVVADGLPASAMPYWRDVLSPAEIDAVVEYVKSLAPARAASPPSAIRVPPRVAPDSASIARGRALYASRGCIACHGTDGRMRATLVDATGHAVHARDLTAPWTFRGGSTPEAIWLRLTTGLAPSPMPSVAGVTTERERWDIVNYVLSLRRTPPWEAHGTFGGAGASTSRVKRGEYLVHAEICGLCHTPIDPTGIYRDSMYLAGGMRVGAYPHGIFVTRNLPGDSATGLGRWSDEEIARTLRTGHAPTRTLDPWGMPWIAFHALSDSDALAIGAYLKRLPPRHNQAPDPLRYSVLETVVRKVALGLPAAMPVLLTYTEGNWSRTQPGISRSLPQTVLVWAQWVVLVLGLAAWFMVRDRQRRAGELPPSSRAKRVLAVIGLALLAVVLWITYQAPALRFIPPERIAGPLQRRIPTIDSSALGAVRTRMAARGRYLFSVAGCAFCHGPRGDGGSKLSWRTYGTRFARNLTSDSTTGIGAWSDAEIARAIRSGVAKNGRTLHWQAMVWDHASNWDEEDLRAIITYLRLLPAVQHVIPEVSPPSSADCAVYTFWIRTNELRGCR